MAWDIKDQSERQRLIKDLHKDYADGCGKKIAADCYHLGRLLEAVLQDSDGASQVYRETCDNLNCAKSCLNYARIKDDRALAHEYNTKACRLGRAEACLGAGLACLPGLDDSLHVRLDLAAGRDYLEQGCRSGCADSCYLVGGLHLTGMPGIMDRDLTSCFKYDFMACHLGQRLACANMRGNIPVQPPKSKEENDPMSNGFLWRLMQLRVDHSRRKK